MKEKFKLKKSIHENKDRISYVNTVYKSDKDKYSYNSKSSINLKKIDTYFNKLVAAATVEKVVLDKLVQNNKKLIN